jgi:hypothetical protein
MAKAMKGNIHHDNYNENTAIDNSKNVKNTEHFGLRQIGVLI